MLKQSYQKAVVGALLVCLASVAWAQAGTSDEEATARLEAVLAAQQQQIDELQGQVASAAGQDVDAARAESMKQQIREVLSEAEFRESLVPSTLQAGYDNGFFIRSSDDKFLMTFFGRIQFRYTYYGTRADNRYLVPGFRRHDRSGFSTERIRFGVLGHAYSKDLTYYLELEADDADRYTFLLSEACIKYRFVDELQFAAGLLKFASTRAQMMSDANLQFVDRPMVDAVFGLGYGIGVRFWGNLLDGTLDYYVDVGNGMTNGEGTAIGRVITNDEERELDNNPAIMFRTVWHALTGDDGQGGASDGRPGCRVDMGTQADHACTQTPALDIGFHYAFNADESDVWTSAIPYPRRTFFRDGGFGLTNSNGLQVHQFGLETGFKYMGFSATGEYILRLLDVHNGDSVPFTPLFQATGDGSTNAQHGAYVQCGYFLPIPGHEKKFEVVGRVGGISTLSGGAEGTWEYAGGLNYYLVGDKVKLQTDVAKVSEVPITSSRYSLANVNDDALIWRVQLQVAF